LNFVPASRRAQWWLVVVLSLLVMLSSVDRLALSLLIDPIKTDLHLSDTEVSLLYGLAFALIYSVATVPAGWMADRWIRRRIVGIGAVLWSGMTVCCGLATGYAQLFLARMGLGLAESLLNPAAQSMVRDGVDPDRHGRAFAGLAMAGYVGAALAALLGGALIAFATAHAGQSWPLIGVVVPWKFTLTTLGVVGLPLSALLLTVREPVRLEARPEAGGYAAALRFAATQPALFGALLVYAIGNGVVSSAYGAWLPVLLGRVWHYSPADIGRFYGIALFFCAPVGLLMIGAIIDRVTRLRVRGGVALVGMIGAAAIGLTSIYTPIAASRSEFWLSFTLQILIAGTPLPVIATILARRTPSSLMGRMVAMQLLAAGIIGTAFAPTLVALVSKTFYAASAVPIAPAVSTVAGVMSAITVVAGWVIYRVEVRIQDAGR
jgi:MFS family permease